MAHLLPFDDAVMLSHDNIWTKSEYLNVLIPFGGPHQWNNHFRGVKRRKRNQTIHDYLRQCVMEALTLAHPRWLNRIERITIWEDYTRGRGEYSWVAWGKPE